MSVSTASEIEACPRRWILGNAAYPKLWSKHGYPPRANAKALAGTVVHYALEALTKAFMRAGCSAVASKESTDLLRELGGFTCVLETCVERVVSDLESNPRAIGTVESVRRTLRAQLPSLRALTQTLFGRLQLRARPAEPWRTGAKERRPLKAGSYAELEVRDPDVGWKGKLDVLFLSDSDCEIVDFKTGEADPKHAQQVKTYAVLWQRDQDLNPTARAATKLTLSYPHGEADVPVPGAQEVASHAAELDARRKSLMALVQAAPGEARPSSDNCRYCSVRQLCNDYWKRSVPETDPGATFGDLDVRIVRQHGLRSWDAIVEVSPNLAGLVGTALLREATEQPSLKPGMRLRVIGARVNRPVDEGDVPVVQLVSTSEVFVRGN